MIADVGASSDISVAAIVDAYEASSKALVRFATMLVGRADADDVVSEALIRVLDQAERRALPNPTAYLYRSVSNTAKNHHRSRARRLGREKRAVEPETRPGAAGLAPEVLQAVKGLSQQQRAVIFLTYWADLTPTAVADYLDISEGSVRKQLARGRAKLAEVLNV